MVVWHWHNHLCSNLPADKGIVRINCDDLVMCLFAGTVKNNLVILKKKIPAKAVPAASKCTHYTNVALICNDASLRNLLPCIVIGNEYTLKAKDMAALPPKCPKNESLLRNDSSWVNCAVSAQIVRMIADALRRKIFDDTSDSNVWRSLCTLDKLDVACMLQCRVLANIDSNVDEQIFPGYLLKRLGFS